MLLYLILSTKKKKQESIEEYYKNNKKVSVDVIKIIVEYRNIMSNNK